MEVDNVNTPVLITKRLILRKFTDKDMKALFLILKDEEVNKFLPWYPLKNLEETRKFYEERYALKYVQPQAYAYAICLKEDNFPIGYVNVDMEEHHDFGYGLRQEFWHRGIVTEAGKAVIEQVKKDGLPYITATHDKNNPRSGNVMRRVGMTYRYSYEEQWQPKDLPVIFRMYQLDFDGNEDFVYKTYWNMSVSYTHLDVYKRQVLYISFISSLLNSSRLKFVMMDSYSSLPSSLNRTTRK